MTGSEENVSALGVWQVQSKRLADFMIRTLLPSSDVNEVEVRLRCAESSTKCCKLVGIRDDILRCQLHAQALKVEDDVDDDAPVGDVAVVIKFLELVPERSMDDVCGLGATVLALRVEKILEYCPITIEYGKCKIARPLHSSAFGLS